VGLKHSYFHLGRGINTSSHQLRTFNPCQTRCQMEVVGATPRKKERRNVIFAGQGEYFFVGSVTSTRKLFCVQQQCVCVLFPVTPAEILSCNGKSLCFQSCSSRILVMIPLICGFSVFDFLLIYCPLKKKEKKASVFSNTLKHSLNDN